MDNLKDEKPVLTAETDIEAVVFRESAAALRRFRSGDFASRLKARLDAPPARRPFFLFRKPVFIPALGFLVLAMAGLVIFLPPGTGKGQVEAGFRFMTNALAQSELFRSAGSRFFSGETGEAASGGAASFFTEALSRIAAEAEAGSAEGGAPLRPLFSPQERLKILYGDQAILRVLTKIAKLKEV
jgi:hypothetical protein